MTELIDSHVHFDSFEEQGTTDAMLARAAEAGVYRMVAIGGRAAANELAIRLARLHPDRIRAVVGHDRDQAVAAPSVAEVERLVDDPFVAGIGEIGLDYHYEPHTRAEQIKLLEGMLDLARRRKLPVILHNRESEDDLFALLSDHARQWEGDPGRIGVLHCYTADIPFARKLLDLGLTISFSGIATFRNADPLREVARFVPEAALLVETDSPYLTPVPLRGRPNEPAFVRHVAEKIAEVRGCRYEDIAAVTTHNAMRLFAWKDMK